MLIFDEINDKMYTRYKIIKHIGYNVNVKTLELTAYIFLKSDIILNTNNSSYSSIEDDIDTLVNNYIIKSRYNKILKIKKI